MSKACALVALLCGGAGGAGCASGVCADCPSAMLTANGATELTLGAGDMVTYEWASQNADIASSTVAIQPAADRCGNKDGAWVVDTLMGNTLPSPLLECQSGFAYTLTFTVVQRASGDTASSIVTIVVR